MNITLTAVYICRVNSSNVSQATIGSSTGLTTVMNGAVYSGNVTGTAQTPSAGDYVNIVFVFTNGAMSTQTFNITANQLIDTPFT